MSWASFFLPAACSEYHQVSVEDNIDGVTAEPLRRQRPLIFCPWSEQGEAYSESVSGILRTLSMVRTVSLGKQDTECSPNGYGITSQECVKMLQEARRQCSMGPKHGEPSSKSVSGIMRLLSMVRTEALEKAKSW